MSDISRQAYADMFGPTTGDKVRLADTELWIEVEDDLTTYGEEVKFGGGKVIRDGMGQGQMLSAGCVDLVLTNALIVDYWGLSKPISASKTDGSSRSAKPATRIFSPTSRSRSERPRKLLRRKARSSPPAASIRIFTGSVRSRRKRRWSPASPP